MESLVRGKDCTPIVYKVVAFKNLQKYMSLHLTLENSKQFTDCQRLVYSRDLNLHSLFAMSSLISLFSLKQVIRKTKLHDIRNPPVGFLIINIQSRAFVSICS